ncbi:MAG: squalene cyclase, partial [Mesorhizobium sp.]
MTAAGDVIAWLLDSDPAIRWQVMRDLLDTPVPEWAAERAKIETIGWGAKLLACQDEDGQWAAGSFVPRGFKPQDWEKFGQPWTATTFSL